MVLFPLHELLPPVSILEKLNAYDPKAAATIIERAGIIGDTRRKEDLQTQSDFHAKRLRNIPALVASGLASMFNAMGSFFADHKSARPDVLSVPEKMDTETAVNFAWAQTGNDIRMAIGHYINENNGVMAHVVLTPEEYKSLELLPVPDHAWVSLYQEEIVLKPFRAANPPMASSPA